MTLDHEVSQEQGAPRISVSTNSEVLADDDLLPPERWVENNLVGTLNDRWCDNSSSIDAELRQQLRRGQVEAYVRALERRRIEIPVDGHNVEFLVIGDDTAWSAYGTWGSVGITLVARGVAVHDVELEPADVAQYERASW